MNKKNGYFKIQGGNRLCGEIINQPSKNATLPIMSACLLAKGKTTLREYPKITDVENMIGILKKLGAKIKKVENMLEIGTENLQSSFVDCKLSKTMRSSIFLLGSLLARFKIACVTLPGGCNIGKRPIDIHISAFKKLGVAVTYIEDNILFNAQNAKANTVKLKLPSVGATENLVQFCATLNGKSTILNAAREPEVVDLCNFLNKMGAKITGAGTSKITIYGVNKLYSTNYKPIGDRIVAGTIMLATAICGGNVKILNACPYANLKLIEKLCSMGCQINIKNDIIHIVSNGKLVSPKIISTSYYPKFPTDLQSQMLAVCCVSSGTTTVTENVFENRFQIVEELQKMGASINKLSASKVTVDGVECLNGTHVHAKDLRGGAALVVAGLVANGETVVHDIYHIERGYEKLEHTLSLLGANIKKNE